MGIVSIMSKIKISLTNDDGFTFGGSLHRVYSLFDLMNLKVRSFFPENISEGVPFELSFHLELFIEDAIWLINGDGLDLRINLLCTSLPKNNDVHRFLYGDRSLFYIQVN